MYRLSSELSLQLPNDLENEEILGKSQNWVQVYPSAQPPFQK